MHNPELTRIAGGLIAGALLVLGGYAVAARVTNRIVVSVVLAAVLVGYFAVWVILAEPAREQSWLAVILFAGAAGLFRLMGRFERPR